MKPIKYWLLPAMLFLSFKSHAVMKYEEVHYHTIKVKGIKIFYREAGPAEAPVILLMHGYPTSSFMFRNLIPILSQKYHVIAPDMPGFGFSDFPSRKDYRYTFDNIAETMQGFIDEMQLKRFSLYIFDYGAPVGLRLAVHNPERITGIVSQNGNAYEQGLLDWSHGRVKSYWDNPSPENRQAIKNFFSLEGTNFQYHEGVADSSSIAPEGIFLDQQLMNRPDNIEMQMDLLLDYRNNIKLYPAFQQYFRDYQPPILAVWGNKDPYFSPAGAEGFAKDDPNTTVKFYNTGHFALETHCPQIGQDILDFMSKLPRFSKNDSHSVESASYHYDSVKVTSKYRFEKDLSTRNTAFARIVYPVFADPILNDLIRATAVAPFSTRHKFTNTLLATAPLPPTNDPVYQPAAGYQYLVANFIKTFEAQAAEETLKGYWYADIHVTVASVSQDYISCLCKTDYFVGGLHDDYDYTYLNYDTRTHQLMSLAAQFKPNKWKQLSKIAERIFRANEKLSPTQELDAYFFDDDTFELTSNFTITEQGLKFLYIPYEIKPFQAGTTEVLIPFCDLEDLYLPNSILGDKIQAKK